jgi:hypothetical protein
MPEWLCRRASNLTNELFAFLKIVNLFNNDLFDPQNH